MNPYPDSLAVENHDEYIRAAPVGARPILVELRRLVHAVLPEVSEVLRWRHPAFVQHGIVADMWTSDEYVQFTVWGGMDRGASRGLLTRIGNTSNGYCRIRSLDQVPTRARLQPLLLQAVERNEARARTRGTLPTASGSDGSQGP